MDGRERGREGERERGREERERERKRGSAARRGGSEAKPSSMTVEREGGPGASGEGAGSHDNNGNTSSGDNGVAGKGNSNSNLAEVLGGGSAGANAWFDAAKFSGKGAGGAGAGASTSGGEAGQKREGDSEDHADVHKYIDELRLYVPTEKIQAELRQLLANLKQELVDLINRDYDDFVNLSTNLVDVNSSVDRIRRPLEELRSTLAQKKSAVDGELASLNEGLRQRAEVGRAKATLILVQDTTNVVSKVEKLLSEMAPGATASTASAAGGERERESQGELDARSQQLERVSSEYSRLKYYLSKGQGLAFLSNMAEQLRAIDAKFFTLLDTCAASAFERRHMPTIQRCISAYNSVGSPQAAEEAFQHAVIRPIVSQVLVGGHAAGAGAHHHHHQQAKKAPIAEVYKTLLEEVASQAGEIIESINGQLSGAGKSCNIAAAIVAETDMAVSAARPNIYSPGIPDAFRENYLASIAFLKQVARYCPEGLTREFQESSAVQVSRNTLHSTALHYKRETREREQRERDPAN